MKRISFDKYFMKIAEIVSLRSTCPRKQIGAVVVKDKQIMSTGYNGAPQGLRHCIDVGCLIKNNHCIRTVHAEENALLFAGKNASGGILYSTVLPCDKCFKLALQINIKKIIYKEDYK